MRKTVIFAFPDDFEFPQYYQDNIRTGLHDSACDDCPFNYDTISCRLSEDGTDGPWECPFYDKDVVKSAIETAKERKKKMYDELKLFLCQEE